MIDVPLLIAITTLLAGFVLLAVGSHNLVAGSASLAKRLGVPTMIIGLTIIAMGTSLPELVTSVIASLHQAPNMAVGSNVGSNIANLSIVLGITALYLPLNIKSKTLKQEIPVYFIAMLLIGIFMYRQFLSRFEGLALIVCALTYIIWIIQQSLEKRRKEKSLEKSFQQGINIKASRLKITTQILLGLILLPFSSEIVIQGAIHIAEHFHISNLIIGLTILALGTSLPELATTIAAARKKEHDIIIGCLIGSNIFNMLFILPLAAVICPIKIQNYAFFRDWGAMFMVGIIFCLIVYGVKTKNRQKITRFKGAILILAYLVYMGVLLITG